MNIAHLLPSSAVFPLKKHNGRYEWALRLARLQAAQGHRVTIYAGEGSFDNSSIIWRSLSHISTEKQQRNLDLMTSALDNPEHDVFHSHFDSLHFLLATNTHKPIIATQHWYPTETIAEVARTHPAANVFTVPVTDRMKQENERLGIPSSDRIHHGIDLDLFRPDFTSSNRFVCIGRVHPSKGTAEAVRYVKLTGTQLDIIGKVNATEQAYWESFVGDIDGERIRYHGSLPQGTVAEILRQSKALIFPIQAEEAFGQVIIEAQACGTPVIISGAGSSPELVSDSVTGFVCKSDADFKQAILKIDTIDRRACRAFAEQFDIKNMLASYQSLYEEAVRKHTDL